MGRLTGLTEHSISIQRRLPAHPATSRRRRPCILWVRGGFAFQTPQGAGGPGQPGPIDFESKVGDVLMKFKSTDIIPLVYTTSSKAVDFHGWTFKMRMLLDSKHNHIGHWWE